MDGGQIVKDDSTVLAQVQTLDRVQAEQERYKKLAEGKPAAYQDKFMDATQLPSNNEYDEPLSADAAGFRSYLVETRVGYAATWVYAPNTALTH